MEFPTSKFSFTVKSTTAKPPKTTEPELLIAGNNKGKFKLNEAGSTLLNVKPGDYLAFVNNEVQINQVLEAYKQDDPEAVAWVQEQGGIDEVKVQWAIAKGWELLDAAGNVQTVKKPLTKVEEEALREKGEVGEDGKVVAPDIPAHKGSRLNAKSSDVKVGMILDGTDSTNCPVMRKGVPEDMHLVFSIAKEGIPVQFPNGNSTADVTVFPITVDRQEAKIEKNKG